MAISESQHQAISNEIESINISITNLKNGIKIAAERLKRLHDAGFDVETVFLNSQLIEHAVKMILRAYKIKLNINYILGKTDEFFGINLGDFEEQTLGALIKLLTKFMGKGVLTHQLWYFNNQFRRDFTHKIFDGSRDIRTVEEEARTYFSSEDFSKMIMGLASALRQIQSETENLYPTSL